MGEDLQTKQYKGQLAALEKCKEAIELKTRKGTLLNMGMGTGKTRASIMWLNYLQENVIPADKTLVVVVACPKALLPEPKAMNPSGWAGEIKKWWHVSPPETYMERRDSVSCAKKAEVIADLCTEHATGRMKGIPLVIAQSYDSWRQPALKKILDAIGKTKTFYKVLICDESHRCKGYKSATSKTMWAFSDMADNVLLLTGTPMPHNPLDIWAQARMVDVSMYGKSYFAFRQKYAVMKTLPGGVNMFLCMNKYTAPELKERMDTFTYSLSVEDALDLPPLTHNIIHVTMDAKEQKAYLQMKLQMITEIENMKAIGEVTAANVLSQVGKLSQITGGSIKAEDGSIISIGDSKADAVRELLREDIPEDEPVVIFTRYRADIDKCLGAAKDCGRKGFELSGRKKELEDWRSDTGGSVLVVQESAGGVGIELQRAHYVIYYSVNYSLGEFDQSVARLHRAGQTMPVSAIHLISPGTIDEVIYESIHEKRNMVDMILKYAGVFQNNDEHAENWDGDISGMFDD